MKRLVKLVAFVIDMAFVPVRLVVNAQTLLSACIIYEVNFREAFVDLIKATVYQLKEGFMPVLRVVLKKEESRK